jgi:hypothetical protein
VIGSQQSLVEIAANHFSILLENPNNGQAPRGLPFAPVLHLSVSNL